MKKSIGILSILISLLFSISEAQNKIITIDFNTNLGRLKNLDGINGNPGNAIQGYKDAEFNLIRTHPRGDNTDYDIYTTFFDKNTMSFNQDFDPTDQNHYNWVSTDAVIAKIEDNGFKSYFRIGIPWPYDTTPTSPPFDPDGFNFTKFAEICRRTVMHYNEGWDNGFHYDIQYWEIWNEPDGRFWDGTPQQFFRLYDASVRAIKSVDPNLIVGAPAATPKAAVPKKPEYFHDFLTYCNKNKVPLDFYSWHLYGVEDPYMIKEYSEYIREVLDQYGFTETESHLNEINIDTGQSENPDLNSPKGAAYVASSLITLQFSPVDELFWFRGQGHPRLEIFESDNNGKPQYKWNGWPFKMMNYIVKETPIRISALGADTVSAYNNFMVLAGKSEDKKEVYLLVSNYAGVVEYFTVILNNLPWDTGDNVICTINSVNPDNFYTEQVQTLSGGTSINYMVNDASSPSVTLLRFQYTGIPTALDENELSPDNFFLGQNYPNPFNSATTITYQLLKASHIILKIYNIFGKEIKTIENENKQSGIYSVKWDGTNNSGIRVSSGIYFYKLETNTGFVEIKKMIYLS